MRAIGPRCEGLAQVSAKILQRSWARCRAWKPGPLLLNTPYREALPCQPARVSSQDELGAALPEHGEGICEIHTHGLAGIRDLDPFASAGGRYLMGDHRAVVGSGIRNDEVIGVVSREGT